MKKLFGMKKGGNIRSRHRDREQYEDELLDFDEEEYEDDEYEDEYSDEDYEDEGYPEEDNYEDEVDEDYPEEDNYEDEADEEYFEDDDYRDGEVYEDENYDDEDYPEEDNYEGEVDEDYPEDDNYEDEYPEDDYDDEYYSEDRHREDDDNSIGQKILSFLANTTAAERIAAVFALLIIAGGIFTASFYASAVGSNKQLEAFSEVGSTMEGVEIVGESGLLAVADAEKARLIAAKLVADTYEEEEEEEVADDAEGVTIQMTVTSIKSDIKVKFINSATSKLVANVPFEIEVTDGNGTTVTYNDHDQDGIIYKTDITAGTYKITPKALSSEYSNYKLEISTKTLTVKDTVEMKAVDVSNEIKKESQVNAAKEDTAVKTETESALTDTVEWVESTKTPVSGTSDGTYTYEEIDKSTISDPTSSSSLVGLSSVKYALRSMLLTSTTDASIDGDKEANTDSSSDSSTESGSSDNKQEETKDTITIGSGDITLTVGDDYTISAGGTDKTISFDSNNTGVATVSSSGTVKGIAAGSATITASADNCESASITVTVKEKEKESFSVDGNTISVQVGATQSIGASASSTISYKSKDTSIATVSDGVVTGVAVGTTTITLSADGYKDGTVTVEVTKVADKTMSVSLDSTSIKVGGTAKLTVSGPSSPSFETSDSGILAITTSGTTCTVTGKKEGTATITISATGYTTEKKEITVTAADKKSITVTASASSIKVGATATLTVTGPSSYSFTSSDKTIATVSEKGVVVGVKAGTATITIAAADSDADTYNSTTVSIEVTAADSTKVPMKISKINLVEGQSIKISSSDSSLSITLSTASSSVASVSGTTITGASEGETTITVSASGYADNTVSVKVYGKNTILKDKNGNVVYVLKNDGSYYEATYEDYYNRSKFYIKATTTTYTYTGWQTIGGKTYFFDKNGNYVTGEQVIQGAKYTFGSDGALSTGSGTMGIDVSKWNGNIDWASVKNSGISYVIIRCGYRGSSEGALIEDPKFKTNINGAINAGLNVGVYFFTQAVNEVEAVEEASMVINLIKGYNITYPVYLDVEASNGRGDSISASQRTANIRAFCGTIQNAGYKAGLYANKTWLTSYINTASLTNYRIWLAQYAASPTYSATRYDMWQYSSKGKVTGISGNVDMNICY